MTEHEYLSDRLENQINWYSTKSQWNQQWFKTLRILEIVCAAGIPFLAGYMSKGATIINIITGLLGLVIAVSTGIQGLYKLQENWIQYRNTAESLKHEKYLYLSKVEPYHQECSFTSFVQRVELLISKENSNWSQYVTRQKESHSQRS